MIILSTIITLKSLSAIVLLQQFVLVHLISCMKFNIIPVIIINSSYNIVILFLYKKHTPETFALKWNHGGVLRALPSLAQPLPSNETEAHRAAAGKSRLRISCRMSSYMVQMLLELVQLPSFSQHCYVKPCPPNAQFEICKLLFWQQGRNFWLLIGLDFDSQFFPLSKLAFGYCEVGFLQWKNCDVGKVGGVRPE